MAQMTLRISDELQHRVRSSAERAGQSMNEYVAQVLDAATNPDLAGSDAERTRERLARAGLLADVGRPLERRPDPEEVARARERAGRGTKLSDLVTEGRD